MKDEKLKKAVYELTHNARIRTKELGTALRISQQSASYLLQSLERQKIITARCTIMDPAKFGYVNVLVYCNYTTFDAAQQKEILTYLQKDDAVVSIQEIEQGYDLKLIFSVPNLSSFNKSKKAFIQNWKSKIVIAETYPIVVKHLYPRKYLGPRKPFSEKVIAGDRDVADISTTEKVVLNCLWNNAGQSIIEMSQATKLNPKTIIKVKKSIQEKKIIRGYTSIFTMQELGIQKQQLFLSSEDLSLDEDAKLLHFCFIHPHIVSLTRLLGTYDLLIEIEQEKVSHKDVLKDLRTEFGFHRYKVITAGIVLKEKYIPKSALE